jgi:hypothetical protein
VNSFELERLVSRRLRDLSMPHAPHTLLPRVLAAAKAWAERPWYAREWLTWPLAWQLASLSLLLLTIAGSIAIAPAMQSVVTGAAASIGPAINVDLPSLVEWFHGSASAIRVIWRALVQPLLPYALVIVVLMCGVCATVAVALNRMAFGRA